MKWNLPKNLVNFSQVLWFYWNSSCEDGFLDNIRTNSMLNIDILFLLPYPTMYSLGKFGTNFIAIITWIKLYYFLPSVSEPENRVLNLASADQQKKNSSSFSPSSSEDWLQLSQILHSFGRCDPNFGHSSRSVVFDGIIFSLFCPLWSTEAIDTDQPSTCGRSRTFSAF